MTWRATSARPYRPSILASAAARRATAASTSASAAATAAAASATAAVASFNATTSTAFVALRFGSAMVAPERQGLPDIARRVIGLLL